MAIFKALNESYLAIVTISSGKRNSVFSDIDVDKSLTWVPKLRVPKIDKIVSKSL